MYKLRLQNVIYLANDLSELRQCLCIHNVSEDEGPEIVTTNFTARGIQSIRADGMTADDARCILDNIMLSKQNLFCTENLIWQMGILPSFHLGAVIKARSVCKRT